MSNLNLERSELQELGLRACGNHVQISRHAILINPGNISIGSNVRIDAFCVISAGEQGIVIGDYVHAAVGVSVFGSGGRVVLEDFVGLSGRASIYTASDDYRDGWLIGPTVPSEFRNVTIGDVILSKFAVVGCGSVLLPGVTLGEGCAIGALSVIRKSVASGKIALGNPAAIIGERNTSRLTSLEQKLRASLV